MNIALKDTIRISIQASFTQPKIVECLIVPCELVVPFWGFKCKATPYGCSYFVTKTLYFP